MSGTLSAYSCCSCTEMVVSLKVQFWHHFYWYCTICQSYTACKPAHEIETNRMDEIETKQISWKHSPNNRTTPEVGIYCYYYWVLSIWSGESCILKTHLICCGANHKEACLVYHTSLHTGRHKSDLYYFDSCCIVIYPPFYSQRHDHLEL